MKKHTKIVATISDQRCDVAFLQKLFDAGMNVVRINTAHQEIEGSLKVINNIRQVSDKIAILIDTKGPEIRTTIARDPIRVERGEEIIFKGDPDRPSVPGLIHVNYAGFVNELEIGKRILIDDGELAFTVVDKRGDDLIVKSENQGWIKSRKSVNVPGLSLNLPALSEKDKAYIEFAADNDVAFIAHSFVRRKEDVLAIKQILALKKSKVKIIAKIENQEGVNNIDEILDHAYGVMVARGDLGIEIAAEKIPGIQRQLILACIKRKRPVIIATQMLHTMIENPRPTRAEISDIANGIYGHTDAIMLSGETAYGKYPVESVETMTRVANEVEAVKELSNVTISSIDNEIAAFLANTAHLASNELPIKAVITDTLTGRTGRYLAAFRNRNVIYAACYSKRVMREMALSFGVNAFYLQRKRSTDAFKRAVVSHLLNENKIALEDRVALIGGSFGPRKGATFLEIGQVKDLIHVH
ncbi:MAG: pyruvate kinase [Bacteroidales bacterium]|nr:pyruvate kinase [Bacteroidales bacterium]